MPLWNVYHPVGAYTEQEKREFAGRVTTRPAGCLASMWWPYSMRWTEARSTSEASR